MPRQQRGMNIEAPEAWQRQNGFWQDLTVGRDDDHVGLQPGEFGKHDGRPDLFGLKDGQTKLLRRSLDRRWPEFEIPPRRAVRLSENGLDFMTTTRRERL